MASERTTKTQSQVTLEALRRLEGQQQRTNENLERIHHVLTRLEALLDGFTDNGSTFRANAYDPMLAVYAAILGPIIGDRLDGATAKGSDYVDQMMKGAAPLARQLVNQLDTYRSQQGSLDYLESVIQEKP